MLKKALLATGYYLLTALAIGVHVIGIATRIIGMKNYADEWNESL